MKRAGATAGIVGLIATVTMLTGAPAVPLAAKPASPAPPVARAGTTYHYATAVPQTLTTKATGAAATFTVHHPKQVRSGSHSLAEIAVAAPNLNFTYVEAGWTVESGQPTRLFVFWWRNGKPHCYNFGCGFVDRGKGLRPGVALKAGSTIRLAWKHKSGKWWLFVNGKQSGFYPDRLWDGKFTGTKWFQVFGEVAHGSGHALCEDMGNGKLPSNTTSAKVTEVRFFNGAPVQLSTSTTDSGNNYRLRITSKTSFRYGGPGDC
jgi:hypothetical protein